MHSSECFNWEMKSRRRCSSLSTVWSIKSGRQPVWWRPAIPAQGGCWGRRTSSLWPARIILWDPRSRTTAKTVEGIGRKGPSYTAGRKYDDATAPEKSSVVLQLVKQSSHDSAILLLSTYLRGKKTLYPPKFAHNVHSHYYFLESKIWEVETGGLQVRSQPGWLNETLIQK